MEQAQILDDHPIDSRIHQLVQQPDNGRKLALNDDDIESQEDLAAMFVGKSQNAVQILETDVGCPIPGIESVQAAIHSIGACGNCCLYGVEVPARCQ